MVPGVVWPPSNTKDVGVVIYPNIDPDSGYGIQIISFS